MDPLRAICQELGFFTRGHAREAGYDDRAITREARAGRWLRIRRGYYVMPDIWAALTPEERHIVLSRAVLDSLGDAVALSHVSGAVVQGVTVWGVSLRRVHVTRLDGGAGRIEGDVVHHEGFVADDDIRIVDGLRVLAPARCALETGSMSTPESALVSLDSVLNLALCTDDELQERFAIMAHWPRMRHLHVPVRMADGRSQSAGESRGRWFFWCHHLPAPDLQFEVRDGDGQVVGITDWVWHDRRQLGEFDGFVKYGRLLRPGQDPGEVVFAEKRREDLLREITDYRMSRLIWRDYDTPAVTAERLRRVLRRSG